MQRIRLLYKLIRDKQDINKKDFKNVLGSKRLFTHFGKKEINYSSPISYFKSLVAINGRKMLLTFLLSTISLLFTISTTLFNEYVIRPSMSADTFEFPQQLQLISKILLFKIGKNTILFIGDTLLLFVGYEHYLIGLYAILDIRRLFDGKSINAIETDCEKISNLFYALSTTILSPIEITILLWLLIQTTECTDTLFVLIGLLYLCLYSLGGFLTYRFNIQMLHEKDNRLNMSIIEATHDKLLQQRGKQLRLNWKWLSLQIYTKAIAYTYYFWLFGYLFIWGDRNRIEAHKFLLLMLLGLIRSPIEKLIFASNLLIEVVSSMRRIAKLHADINSLTIPPTWLALPQVRFKKQKGTINPTLLLGSYRKNVHNATTIAFCLTFILFLLAKYQNLPSTSHIISSTFTTYDLIILIIQIILPLSLLALMILISKRLATAVFHQLQFNNTRSNEIINRLSGDITAIDRSICLNAFDFITISTIILTSLFYSLISLNDFVLQLIFFGALLLAICAACYGYAYCMASRRETARNQYTIRSIIIKYAASDHNIQESSSMRTACRQIFEAKCIGALIEVVYSIILFSIVLGISTALTFCVFRMELDATQRTIVVIACMQVDNDLLALFIAAIRVQKALLSFERLLNALKYSSSHNNRTTPNLNNSQALIRQQ